MANPNKNTAEDMAPDTLRDGDMAPDTVRDNQDAGIRRVGEMIEETLNAEKLAKKKGLPVEFRSEAGNLIHGRLVDWNDDQHFAVVGFDGDVLVTKTYTAEELYELNESGEEERDRLEKETLGQEVQPTRLENAVQELKMADKASEEQGAHIRSMLTTVFEQTEAEKKAA